MKKEFSKEWCSSKKPRKQRKYRHTAPLHIKARFMHSPLSKELREKYNARSLRLRKGDTVTVMRGSFKGKKGKVVKISLKDTKAFVENIEIIKTDGSKSQRPIDPSKLMIVELNLEDRKRLEKITKAAKSQDQKN